MKTNASVVKQTPTVTFPSRKKVQNRWNKDGQLTINNSALGKWIDAINKANGAFFVQIEGLDAYSIRYKCNRTGKLLEMDYKGETVGIDRQNEYVDALLLDLNLFEGNEPIVVFDRRVFKYMLDTCFPMMSQHTNAIDLLMERVYDLREIFELKIYYDTLFKEATIKSIHSILYMDSDKEWMKIPDSLAMYEIFDALQSVFYQVCGLKVIK